MLEPCIRVHGMRSSQFAHRYQLCRSVVFSKQLQTIDDSIDRNPYQPNSRKAEISKSRPESIEFERHRQSVNDRRQKSGENKPRSQLVGCRAKLQTLSDLRWPTLLLSFCLFHLPTVEPVEIVCKRLYNIIRIIVNPSQQSSELHMRQTVVVATVARIS